MKEGIMDFGDTGQDDQVQLARDSGPKFESDEIYFEMDPWWELLGNISQDLERLEGELADLRMESQGLEKAGMYPAIPSESWEGRNGGDRVYLRMVFPRRTTGMPRKLYIGNKPEAITEARRLAANRRRWEELEQASIQLERFLRMMRCELASLADRVARYQVEVRGIIRC